MFLLMGPAMLAVWMMARRRSAKDARLNLPGAGQLGSVGGSPWVYLATIQPWVRGVALVLIVLSLARPQAGSTIETVSTHGVDIVLAMDVSYSMLAQDFQPLNRLEVARATVAEFIEGRPTDRIGLVVFGSLAATRGPLTLDHDMLLQLLQEVRVASPERSSTAMGMGLATAVNRLRHSDARSRVAVLITDGRNNAGQIGPMAAAEAARALGIRVYTIGVGTEGEAPIPVDGAIRYVRVDLDEELLQSVATKTDGRYFRVTDAGGMRDRFQVIDGLEKSRIESSVRVQYAELFLWFLATAALLLLLEWLLANTRLRRIP
jgi:Ca-activated chloride channel family protein